MKKADLITTLQSKKGFHSIISDTVAPDNVQGDPIEKRFFYVNHLNADGTMGKTFVYYLWDKATDDAWFYNVEAESVDMKEPSKDQKKFDALLNYLKANFAVFFIIRYDINNSWAEADVFVETAGTLSPKRVVAFKKQGEPVTHLDVVTN